MKRGFILNSGVLILIIPLLLLLATYEDISSGIIEAQSERTQIERTYDVVTFLNLEFQKAMELSGKRAVVGLVDYVAVTGRFISPNYMANNTVKDLIEDGTSPQITGYDPERVMRGQTLRNWLSNVTKILRSQGYEVKESVDELLKEAEIEVAPLDAFTIVVKARIPSITIRDMSGKVVYTGPIPSTGGYMYSLVDIRELEDPIFSAITGGRYQRSLRACPMAYPELGMKPITSANGTGSGSGVIIGQFGSELKYNETHVWDDNGDYLTNFTVDGLSIKVQDIIKNGDTGIMFFNGAYTGGGSSSWCSPLGYRMNLTIRNDVGDDLLDYQIPVLISTAKGFTTQMLDFIFSNTNNAYSGDEYETNASIAFYDTSCNPIPFWIEYWDPVQKKALVWLKLSLPKNSKVTLEMYFGSEIPPTKGDGENVFLFFDDFEKDTMGTKWIVVEQTPTISNGELYIPGGNEIEAIRTKNEINYNGSFSIRFRMRGTSKSNNKDWDSGVGFQDSTQGTNWSMYFTDDVRDLKNTLTVHEGGWWNRDTTVNQQRNGKPTDFHVYEAYLVDTGTWYDANTKMYDVKFKDITDGRTNWDSKYDNSRLLDPPALKYLYLVNDNDDSGNEGVYDFVFVRKYPPTNGQSLEDPNFNGINLEWRTTTLSEVVESKLTGSSGSVQSSIGRLYDIQTLIDCLQDNRYFATENGWSFFERLEGSNENHNDYAELSHQLQDELGHKYGDRYYPIGLVSFMIPHSAYDQKLLNLMNALGIGVDEGQSSTDYYFLFHYFKNGEFTQGYRVWGVSYGTTATNGNLETIPFFLDPPTAKALFGNEATCDLLYGYSCQ